MPNIGKMQIVCPPWNELLIVVRTSSLLSKCLIYLKPIASEQAKIPISHSQTILDPQIDHWGNLVFLYLSNTLIPIKGFSFSNLDLVNVTSNNHIHGLPPLFS
jgi:hypothetical protein